MTDLLMSDWSGWLFACIAVIGIAMGALAYWWLGSRG